jgi:hypothetical protein
VQVVREAGVARDWGLAQHRPDDPGKKPYAYEPGEVAGAGHSDKAASMEARQACSSGEPSTNAAGSSG